MILNVKVEVIGISVYPNKPFAPHCKVTDFFRKARKNALQIPIQIDHS